MKNKIECLKPFDKGQDVQERVQLKEGGVDNEYTDVHTPLSEPPLTFPRTGEYSCH